MPLTLNRISNPAILQATGKTWKERLILLDKLGAKKMAHKDITRLIWKPKAWPSPATLQVTVSPRKSTRGTCIRFHEEQLPNKTAGLTMREHWQGVLEKLVKL